MEVSSKYYMILTFACAFRLAAAHSKIVLARCAAFDPISAESSFFTRKLYTPRPSLSTSPHNAVRTYGSYARGAQRNSGYYTLRCRAICHNLAQRGRRQPDRLRENWPQPQTHKGHQGPIPGLHWQAGYLPRKGRHRVWYQRRRRHQPKESWL